MYKYTFTNSLNSLHIYSLSQVLSNVLHSINKFVLFTLRETNHKKATSLIAKFNLVEKDILLEVPREFIDFLDICITLIQDYPQLHMYITGNHYNLNDLYQFKNGYIKKNVNFMLDTSFIRMPFIIESIAYILKQNRISTFFIKDSTYRFGSGKQNWLVEIEFDEDIKVKTNVNNGTVASFWNVTKKQIDPVMSSFGVEDKTIDGLYYAVKADTPVESMIAFHSIKDKHTKFEIERAIAYQNITLQVINSTGKAYRF